MPILRSDIERALDEIASQEEGMRFQGLAVVLGKKRWPELIARQRKKDGGLDAYAPANLTADGIGKGLAASITPTYKKISGDVKTAQERFKDLGSLLFVTSAKVGNADRDQWEQKIRSDHGIDLYIIEREEIITQMLMPENASLCASTLNLEGTAEPQVADLIDKVRRAAAVVAADWERRLKGHPVVDLASVVLDADGGDSSKIMSLEEFDEALYQSRRVVLEGPAGSGKTTALIRLANRQRSAGTAFLVDLPAWSSSGLRILEFIAGMPAFQAEGLTLADLARVRQSEPFIFLLNGWNEVADNNALLASGSLRELEREFPAAGILVATRTHHITPPLPGASRTRILSLNNSQRASYLLARLGEDTGLLTSIESHPSLDALTRSPFILSEVASLYEAGAEIPTTKIGVIGRVIELHESRDEHRNSLQAGPVFGYQAEYAKALGVEMTRRGSVSLVESQARSIIAQVVQRLTAQGEITQVSAHNVLASLTAHHVLRRADYPEASIHFEHQQIQEYYASIEVRAQLLELLDRGVEAEHTFRAQYVNRPAWSEPLRMIAADLERKTAPSTENHVLVSAGQRLIKLAADVDIVFAGELARLAGTSIWIAARAEFSEHVRRIFSMSQRSFVDLAITSMLATGYESFSDIIEPMLSSEDQQVRLRTYRLWPHFTPTSIAEDWNNVVVGWSERARVDFVSEILHQGTNAGVVRMAVEDESSSVKLAAAIGLMWSRADAHLLEVVDSMTGETFSKFALANAREMPSALSSRVVAAIEESLAAGMRPREVLRSALDLIELGEDVDVDLLKDAIEDLLSEDDFPRHQHSIRPALDRLTATDQVWVSDWVARNVAEGPLYDHENWLRYVADVPASLVDRYLARLQQEDLSGGRAEGMCAVIAAGADTDVAMRIVGEIRRLRSITQGRGRDGRELEYRAAHQLESVFLALPVQVAVSGLLQVVSEGTANDVLLAARLLGSSARSSESQLATIDGELKESLRALLKSGIASVLQMDDFTGEVKANLASALGRVGQEADLADLMTLARADIDRVRRGRADRGLGRQTPAAEGCVMSYSSWHINAIVSLACAEADEALIQLLREPEYRVDASSAMARGYVRRPDRLMRSAVRFREIWSARASSLEIEQDGRRVRFADALAEEASRLIIAQDSGGDTGGLDEVARSLAVVGGITSSAVVLDAIASCARRSFYTVADTLEALNLAGVVIPATSMLPIVDAMVGDGGRWLHESDRYLLRRFLSLCPFVDDAVAGIEKIRQVLAQREIWAHEMHEVVEALGQSREERAVALLLELASDASVFDQCKTDFINAFATLDTTRAREILLSAVDPQIDGFDLDWRTGGDELLASRLGELVTKSGETGRRLEDICELDLPEFARHVLAIVVPSFGSDRAIASSLRLLDDMASDPIPQGIWDFMKSSFVERRPYEQQENWFTEHSRESNSLRSQLFLIAAEDDRRRRSATRLLGVLELWRVEYGRPISEPRHPNLASVALWPPIDA